MQLLEQLVHLIFGFCLAFGFVFLFLSLLHHHQVIIIFIGIGKLPSHLTKALALMEKFRAFLQNI